MPIDPDGVARHQPRPAWPPYAPTLADDQQFVEANKAEAARLSLIDRLDYMGELSSQLEWQSNPASTPE